MLARGRRIGLGAARAPGPAQPTPVATPPGSAGTPTGRRPSNRQRNDDSEETVRTRLEVYHTQTEPIIDYYRAQGLVVTISAMGPVDEVTSRALEALKSGQ